MRLLSPIILILFGAMNHFRHQLPVSDSITTKLIGNDLTRFTTAASRQAFEEFLCSSAITLCLKININDLTVAIDSAPQVMLLTVDFDEDFLDVERVTLALMLSFQSASINRSKLDVPETNRFAADSDSSLSE
jgi:hypothetical protein